MKQDYSYSEAELVSGCRDNSPRHQRALYQRYYRKMFGVCLRYTHQASDAEDVLQDAFIKVFRYVDSFRGQGSLEGWVRRIVVRTAIEQYRRNSRFTEVDIDTAEGMELQADQLAQLGQAEILKLVQALPAGYRAVFNLYVIEGYPHKEIASMLNISEGTSKSQLSRAKALLKVQIEKQESTGKRLLQK